tara:strand:+ start:2213 stop:4228 length:2016 start_codon:yes stop_codon:yes gene_type:complete
MISLVTLLAAWLFVLGVSPFRSSSITPYVKSLYWGLSFVVASSCLYVLYYIQINFLPNLWMNRIAVLFELVIAIFFLIQLLFKGKALQSFRQPFTHKGRFILFSSVITAAILFLFSLLTSSPLNWDVNAYNLARVPAMLAEGSTFLPIQTASPRQAAFSLGHDILFYPDLVWGLLRGLPLICSAQFMVLLGIVLAVTSELISRVSLRNHLRPNKSNYVFMIAFLLMLNSNQQVMQAVISKNDLFVALIFMLSLGFGLLGIVRSQHTVQKPSFIVTPMLFLGIAAFSIKSYGIILFIPLFVLFGFAIARRTFDHYFVEISLFKTNSLNIFWLLVGTVAALMLLIDFAQRGYIQDEWAGSLEGVTSLWTNTHGSLLSRLSNAVLNAQRIFLQGLLFPLTTLKPYFPIGPELSSPISQSWVPFWLSGTSGSAGSAYEFQLLFGTNTDMAYPFLAFWIGLVFGTIGWFIRRPIRGVSEAIYIILCSIFAFAFFSSVVLYQPWLSRFLGPTYIPLVPVAAVGFGLLIEPIQLSSTLRRGFCYLFIPLLGLISFLPLISSLSLSGYISKRAGMPQDDSYFYYQYLWTQTGLSQPEAKRLVHILRDSRFQKRSLCASGTTWTLTPMILTQASQPYKDNAELLSREACSEEIKALTGEAVVMDKGEVIKIDGHQFINLP